MRLNVLSYSLALGRTQFKKKKIQPILGGKNKTINLSVTNNAIETAPKQPWKIKKAWISISERPSKEDKTSICEFLKGRTIIIQIKLHNRPTGNNVGNGRNKWVLCVIH